MKYILELEDEPNKEYFGEGNYYRCKQIPYWSISESMRNRLEPYDEADRKTKSTISKMEQVDKDINVRSKDCETCKHYKLACELFSEICKYEPTTQTETQNSNLTFEKDECAKEYEELGLKELKELIEADRKTEPQTDCDKHCVQTEVGCENADCAWK